MQTSWLQCSLLCSTSRWSNATSPRCFKTLHHSADSQEAQHSKPERLPTGRSDLSGHESVRAPGSQVPQGSPLIISWTRTSSPTGPTDPSMTLSRLPCITFCNTSRPPAHMPRVLFVDFSSAFKHDHPHGSCLTN